LQCVIILKIGPILFNPQFKHIYSSTLVL
jgi:hypothetical protein